MNELSSNNFFKYAETEHNAFICWLLSHLKEENNEADPLLQECATLFIRQFYPGFSPNEKITDIKCGYKNIGVLIVINEKYFLFNVKINPGSHDKQIKTLTDEGIPENSIHSIYFEIVNQFYTDCDYDHKFTLKKILKIFEPYRNLTDNCIFCDYYGYLKFIEDEVESYKYLP